MKSRLLIAASLSLLQVGIVLPASARHQDGDANQLIAAAGSKKTLKGKVDREVVMGDDLMLQGKYNDAETLYQQVIKRSKHGPNLPAMGGFGMALAKQYKLDAADQEFDKILAANSRFAPAYAGKATVIYNRLQSSNMTQIKNRDALLKQAESLCQQGLAIDPSCVEAHYALGNIYKEQGRIDDSIREFRSATQEEPKYSEAFSGLGMSQLLQGDTAGAATSFRQAISLKSGNSTAHYGLGRVYLKQGQLDDAIKEFNTSLYQYPNSAPCRLAMGEAYGAQGNTVAAVKEFQESIRIKPENPDAYMHIADIREARGDLEHSIAELRSGLELMPNNPDLHLRIGDESLRLEKLDDAIKEYSAVMDSNPNNAQAAKGLTRAYYLKANKEATGAFFVSNEFEHASQMIDKAVAMNPNDMELRLAQAKLRVLSGKTVDLSQIGTPTNNGERIAYAEALLAQNKFADEEQQMQMVLAACPDAKQTFSVADLALMIKDLPTAEAAYRKAATMPGGDERGRRGLDLVAKAKDTARQDLTLADDLARKKQLGSAIDKYHASVFENPKVASTRYGLAQTLEKLSPHVSKDYREAIAQWKAYIALSPNLPPKELEKLNKHIASLDEKAYKLEMKEREQNRG